jgi:triosephosphate isomerase
MKPLIVGNWKMHKTVAEARAFVHEVRALDLNLAYVDIVIVPAFTALFAVAEALAGRAIGLGAQTMHWEDQGPYTGEVSPPMLREAGVNWVLLGHSERRAASAEVDATINKKVMAALAHGLTPIVAVGETAEEHGAGLAAERVVSQTRAAFDGVSATDASLCVVAYEPIWAIGTGNVDEPADANLIMERIRSSVKGLDRTRILYGGSVKPENIAALMAQPAIDGALVGGASLDPQSLAALVRNAHKHVSE